MGLAQALTFSPHVSGKVNEVRRLSGRDVESCFGKKVVLP